MVIFPGASRDRLARIAKNYLETGENPKEKRGGSRIKKKDIDITDAVMNNIKQYKCRESHYSRKKTVRSYLPPELNIQKMYDKFCSEQNLKNLPTCSLSKFKRIFYTKFNLGFGNPHTDTCSSCKELLLQAKLASSLEDKNKYRTEYKLHKLRSNKFFQIIKEKNDNYIDICFDMQQNQPIPKLSVGETFYSRQVWLYNLCIMENEYPTKLTNIHFYTWLETEAGRGANEVTSALHNFLKKLETRMLKTKKSGLTLRLFSDSCIGQNKNTVLVTMLLRFLQMSKVFAEIKHYFPIRGHSFMPPDRVFGRIEKDYRKHESLVSPNNYYDILKKHGIVQILGRDWSNFDYKQKVKDLIKTKLPFNIIKCRVIGYKKIKKEVSLYVKYTYSECPTEVDIFKKGTNSKKLRYLDNLQQLQKMNHVSVEKSKDVKKLARFFEIPEAAKTFYEDVFNIKSNKDMGENISKEMEDMRDDCLL